MRAMVNQTHTSSLADRQPAPLRSFYFVVVFWGKTFRDYFIDYCLPSLLAPRNIPVLERGAHKFIFCTTAHDWEAISETGIVKTLKRYIEPYFLEITPAPPGKAACEHMGIGHKLATEMCHRDRAYGVFLTPDLMVSDGTVEALQRYARTGAKVVLVAALRFAEEPLFEHLDHMGILKAGKPCRDGAPLVITSREMVAACINSFHSESQRYEFEAPYFTTFPSACWWKVPGEDGIVVHSLSWAPFLFDYAAIDQHDTSALETWTMDGDYVFQNFRSGSDIHVVADSDEMMLVSWAPLADRPQSLFANPLKQLPFIGELIKGGILRASLLSGIFDPLKLRIFFQPVRWHAQAITPAWAETEARARRVLRRYVWDVDPSTARESCLTMRVRKLLLVPIVFLARIWRVVAELSQYRSRLVARLLSALHGDREAWGRIARRVRIMFRWILGAEIRNP